MRQRLRLLPAYTLLGVLCLAVAVVDSPAAHAGTGPSRAEMSSAMLTVRQMERIGLGQVSGANATYTSSTDPALEFTRHGRSLDVFAFAESSSPDGSSTRSVMMTVTYGNAASTPVACRIDEGSPEVIVGRNECVSARRPLGVRRPVGVSYGIKPAPGVNVIAYVAADPVSSTPAWAPPTAAELTAAAKALAQAQVARLRHRGLL